MWQKDRRRCLDACVKRSAECNTDHQLLRIKLRVQGKGGCYPHRSNTHKDFAVSCLMGRAEINSSADTYRSAYREWVSTKAAGGWRDDGTVEEKWSAIQSALVEAAEEVLGHKEWHQLDWFQESAGFLELFFQRRNLLHTKWLDSGRISEHRKFLKAWWDARKAVRDAKDTWFRRKADEAQVGRFCGKKVWRAIRDMQQACRGPIPQRTGNIKDEEGHPCTTSEGKEQRWRRHFTGILNVESHLNPAESDKVRPLQRNQTWATVPGWYLMHSWQTSKLGWFGLNSQRGVLYII